MLQARNARTEKTHGWITSNILTPNWKNGERGDRMHS